MPKFLSLVALALAILTGAAPAADLSGRSRLGAVFAEQPVVVRGAPPVETVVVDPSYIRNSPRVAGYYGQAGDFQYRNYYGTPLSQLHIYSPFTCVIEAMC